jgi:FkbM family methyltransferase
MNQKIEFHYPDGYTHGDIALSQKGWSYSPDDSHFGVWIREAHNICHDSDFVHWCLSSVKTLFSATIVDVGANIGTHTCGYLQIAKKVISIEPFHTSFECLKRNVLKQISNCVHAPSFTGICGAAGRTDDLLHLEIDPKNHGASRISDTGQAVYALGLDALCSGEDISLIKIDAEGYEGEIIVGGSFKAGPLASWRDKDRPSIIIEVNHHALKLQGWNQDGLFGYLREIGYHTLGRWPQELDSLTYEQLKDVPQYDIHCAPA